MSNDTLQAHLQALEQKRRGLVAHYKAQQKVVQQLQEEQAQWKQKASNGGGNTGNFSNSLEIGTIISNEEQVRALGSSIDSYIRDIDKSIAYLERRQ